MSWHFLPGQEAESWGLNSSVGEPCAPLKSTPSVGRRFSDDSVMDAYRGSLFGTISAHSTDVPGEGASISLPEDSLARIYQQRAEAGVSRESVVVCGKRWPVSSVKFNPDTCWWRTHHCLFPADLTSCSLTLPRWGMMRNGELSERTMPERLTSGTGSGYWRTPNASDGEGGIMEMREGASGHYKLRDHVQPVNQRYWPTPTQADAMGGPGNSGRAGGDNLRTVASGALNPDWVEWLMGWPVGWTSLESLEFANIKPWSVDPADTSEVPRIAKGIANRVARLKAIGNGQVPAVVALAWHILNNRIEGEL
jgi:hypothetical protein